MSPLKQNNGNKVTEDRKITMKPVLQRKCLNCRLLKAQSELYRLITHCLAHETQDWEQSQQAG